MNFFTYCSTLRRYLPAELVNAHLSEVIAMYNCGVTVRGAAAHVLLTFAGRKA